MGTMHAERRIPGPFSANIEGKLDASRFGPAPNARRLFAHEAGRKATLALGHGQMLVYPRESRTVATAPSGRSPVRTLENRQHAAFLPQYAISAANMAARAFQLLPIDNARAFAGHIMAVNEEDTRPTLQLLQEAARTIRKTNHATPRLSFPERQPQAVWGGPLSFPLSSLTWPSKPTRSGPPTHLTRQQIRLRKNKRSVTKSCSYTGRPEFGLMESALSALALLATFPRIQAAPIMVGVRQIRGTMWRWRRCIRRNLRACQESFGGLVAMR